MSNLTAKETDNAGMWSRIRALFWHHFATTYLTFRDPANHQNATDEEVDWYHAFMKRHGCPSWPTLRR